MTEDTKFRKTREPTGFDLRPHLCYSVDDPAGHVIWLAHGASQHFTLGSRQSGVDVLALFGQDGSVQLVPALLLQVRTH